MKKINLGKSLKTIDSGAFFGSALTQISFPDTLEIINDTAFSSCSELSEISFGKGIKTIGESAFWGTGLERLVLPEGVEFIGKNSFGDNLKLTYVHLPDSLDEMGEYAFYMCQNLPYIELPKGIRNLPRGAFHTCNKLMAMYIPANVESINSEVFNYGVNPKLYVDANSYAKQYAIDNGLNYEVVSNGAVPDYGMLVKYGKYNSSGKSIWELYDTGLFRIRGTGSTGSSGQYLTIVYNPEYQKMIKYVVIEEGITTISSFSFDGCSYVESVTMAEGVTTIDANAFTGCTSLQKIELPRSISSFQSNSFLSLTSLYVYEGSDAERLAIQYNLSYKYRDSSEDPISEDIISSGSCGTNATWTLDSNGKLTITGTGAMDDYEDSSPFPKNDVKSVVIENGITHIGNNAFFFNWYLSSISIPRSVTSIGRSAICGCNALKSISIPDSVTTMGSFAVSYCSNLESITLPNKLTTISSCLFSSDSKLSSVTIPNTVINIESNAFNGCTSLATLTIPKAVVDIGDSAIPTTTKLNVYSSSAGYTYAVDNGYSYEVFEGSGTDTIVSSGKCGSSAFWTLDVDGLLTISGTGNMEDYYNKETPWGTGVKSVVISGGITYLGSGAFKDCSELISVALPENMTSLGVTTFENCLKLQSIIIPNGISKLYSSLFWDCSNLNFVVIPDTVTEISMFAFNGCNNLTDVYYAGTESQWNTITIGTYNTSLTSATIHYNTNLPSSPDIILPSSLQIIESEAFKGVPATLVQLPTGATYATDSFDDDVIIQRK